MRKNILWDLDGTLTDPKEGIIRCFQYALESFQYPVPSMQDLLWVIGPPIHHSFAQLIPAGSSEQHAWELVAKYRERFATVGMFENEIYQGIPELLSSLKNQNKFLATSKPHVFAKKILTHFKIDQHFKTAYGSELDGVRSDKAELIQYILENEKINPRDAVIIGDRKYDVLGAKKAGISSIGITWGYGSKGELEEAGPDYIFNTPAELQKFLSFS